MSLTELEVAAAQEEVALGELLLILAMRWTLDPIERRSEAFGWKWQAEEPEKETPPGVRLPVEPSGVPEEPHRVSGWETGAWN